jgi:hypothetical protein
MVQAAGQKKESVRGCELSEAVRTYVCVGLHNSLGRKYPIPLLISK